jgi:L,D-transpeptidase ErfK/SrfK
VLNIPEMRLYYYPLPTDLPTHKAKIRPTAFKAGARSSENVAGRAGAQVVYAFAVGLGRFDWKTPVADWRVRGKTKEPTWVVPEDIYEEHLERDGEAEHVVPEEIPTTRLGIIELNSRSRNMRCMGTNVPWGVGMEVSHGCIRLYPEDIQRLFSKVKIGTPGTFVYQPVKFGWRGDALYVEAHDELYGRYPGLYAHALKEVERLGIQNQVDMNKLQSAIQEKTGVPTNVCCTESRGCGCLLSSCTNRRRPELKPSARPQTSQRALRISSRVHSPIFRGQV